MIIYWDSDQKIKWGCSIAEFINEKFQVLDGFRKDAEDTVCDCCGNESITIGGYMCEICNFDICVGCITKKSLHSHPMFKYIGYYGVNTYSKKEMICILTYDIISKKININ